MYADDIKLYAAYDHANPLDIQLELSEALLKTTNWASTWDLKLNLSKCTVLHLGRGEPLNFEVNGSRLKQCNLIKDLGVLIDTNLKFTDHIENVVKKASAVLFTIFRNIHSSSPNIFLRLYKAYVVPRLEYCSPIWNPHLKKETRKLEKVQQTFTRLLFLRMFPNTKFTEVPSYQERLKYFKLDSLEKRRAINDLTFCFKILRGEVNLRPSKYWIFCPSSSRSHGFTLRYRKIQRKKFALVFHSIFCRSIRWFSSLPSEVMQSQNSSAFRSKLKRIDFPFVSASAM